MLPEERKREQYMFVETKPRRLAAIAAVLAFAMGLLLMLSPAMTRDASAGADFESQQEAAIAGSAVRVLIGGAPAGSVWEGKLQGPNGLEITWASMGLANGVFEGSTTNLEAGSYTVVPTTIPAGYKVVGYQIVNTIHPSFACLGNGSGGSSSQFTLTMAVRQVSVCVRVAKVDVIAGSQLLVRAQGDFNVNYEGTVQEPNGVTWTFNQLGQIGAFGWLIPLYPGDYTINAEEIPAPGYKTMGYAVMPFLGPCPDDPTEYFDSNTVAISQAMSKVTVCIRILKTADPIMPSAVQVRVMSPDDKLWQGHLTYPDGFEKPWANLGMSALHDTAHDFGVFPGTYKAEAETPPYPGYVVLGYHAKKAPIKEGPPDCPSDVDAYTANNNQVTVTEQNKFWAICLMVVPEGWEPPEEPTPVFELPEDWMPPVLNPVVTTTPSPTPTSVPTAKPTNGTGSQPTGEPQIPAATATPGSANSGTPETPDINETESGSSSTEAEPTPVAPSTGSSPGATGSSSGTTTLLGALLLVVSGLFLAANLLPGTPKR